MLMGGGLGSLFEISRVFKFVGVTFLLLPQGCSLRDSTLLEVWICSASFADIWEFILLRFVTHCLPLMFFELCSLLVLRSWFVIMSVLSGGNCELYVN
jgi:hypothetical protein